MRPLISVIIPTHNRARLLDEALESVFAQRGIGEEFDMEVIVVDDASSDNTSDVIETRPEVRYIRLPTNGGLAAARNAGVRTSSGKYVAFLDDDDIWLPHKLSQQVPTLELHPDVAAAYSPCIVRSVDKEEALTKIPWLPAKVQHPNQNPGPSGFVLNSLVKENLAPVHGFLLRRIAIERAGYFDEQLRCFEDWDLWLRIALHDPFIFIPGCVGVYQTSAASMLGTATANGDVVPAARNVMEKLRDLLKDSTAPREVVREARARVELYLARYLLPEQETIAQSHLLAAMHISPDLIREPQVRQDIVRLVSEMAFRSADSINFMNNLGRMRWVSPPMKSKIFIHLASRASGRGEKADAVMYMLQSALHSPVEFLLNVKKHLERRLRPISDSDK